MSCEEKPWVVVRKRYSSSGRLLYKEIIGYIYKTKEEARQYLDSIYKTCHIDVEIEFGNSDVDVMTLDDYIDIEIPKREEE